VTYQQAHKGRREGGCGGVQQLREEVTDQGVV
jgi:hypothetical protein